MPSTLRIVLIAAVAAVGGFLFGFDTAVIFIVSGFLSGAAVSLWDFSLWRLLGGIAIGLASVIAPAYIAEMAPAHLRGRLGSLQQLAIVVGIFAALLADYGIAAAAGSAS